jgi:Spy/CpxP family protein refolding chaperone
MKRGLAVLACTLVPASFLLSGMFAWLAPSASAGEENIRNYAELLRSDVSEGKRTMLRQVMKLSGKEADVFWPIYHAYEFELYQQLDKRFKFMSEFVASQLQDSLTNEKAKNLAEAWFSLQDQRMALWKTYYGKMEQALGPVRAAQFVQIEHQVALLLDLAVASEMPYVGALPQPPSR